MLALAFLVLDRRRAASRMASVPYPARRIIYVAIMAFAAAVGVPSTSAWPVAKPAQNGRSARLDALKLVADAIRPVARKGRRNHDQGCASTSWAVPK